MAFKGPFWPKPLNDSTILLLAQSHSMAPLIYQSFLENSGWKKKPKKQNKICVYSVLAWWQYTQMGENMFTEAIGKLSSNWRRKLKWNEMKLKCICIFFLLPFQMLLLFFFFFTGKGEAVQNPPCWAAKWIFPHEIWGENEAATDSLPQLLECNCAQGQAAAASCS